MTWEVWLDEVRTLFAMEGVDLPTESALYRHFTNGLVPLEVLVIVLYG